MRLTDIQPAPGSRHRDKRASRGTAGYRGKTSGRGMKGQKSRGKGTVRVGFEGARSPLYRQLPALRGRSNRAHNIGIFRHEWSVVNLARLEQRFETGAEVTPEAVLGMGLVSKLRDGLKVLGQGELTKPLTVTAHAFSATAKAKIEQAGGTAKVIGE